MSVSVSFDDIALRQALFCSRHKSGEISWSSAALVVESRISCISLESYESLVEKLNLN